MRYLSEETMQRIIVFVDEYYNENSYSPTIAEISRSLSLAVGTVHKYLHRMTEMHKLYFDGRHIITPYIEELQGKFHAPVSGDIACGSPIYAEDQHDDTFPIPIDFIGKGINDAACLIESNCGIAMRSLGSDIAIESSDIVIMNDDIANVNKAIKISKKTMKTVIINIIFSVFVKVLIMVLAMFIKMPIWVAIIGDVGVCLIAILNSLTIMYGKYIK